jgi:hypothetical protein
MLLLTPHVKTLPNSKHKPDMLATLHTSSFPIQDTLAVSRTAPTIEHRLPLAQLTLGDSRL